MHTEDRSFGPDRGRAYSTATRRHALLSAYRELKLQPVQGLSLHDGMHYIVHTMDRSFGPRKGPSLNDGSEIMGNPLMYIVVYYMHIR